MRGRVRIISRFGAWKVVGSGWSGVEWGGVGCSDESLCETGV